MRAGMRGVGGIIARSVGVFMVWGTRGSGSHLPEGDEEQRGRGREAGAAESQTPIPSSRCFPTAHPPSHPVDVHFSFSPSRE